MIYWYLAEVLVEVSCGSFSWTMKRYFSNLFVSEEIRRVVLLLVKKALLVLLEFLMGIANIVHVLWKFYWLMTRL